jgi:hypothetical protein
MKITWQTRCGVESMPERKPAGNGTLNSQSSLMVKEVLGGDVGNIPDRPRERRG